MKETLSILFANLDEASRQTANNAIRGYPSSVISCAYPDEMLDTLEKERVDVLLLNLQQPFDTAFDFLSELRTRSPQTEIVVVSELDDEELWLEAMQRGAYDFLPKPVDLHELKRTLIQAAERHHPLKVLGVTF